MSETNAKLATILVHKKEIVAYGYPRFKKVKIGNSVCTTIHSEMAALDNYVLKRSKKNVKMYTIRMDKTFTIICNSTYCSMCKIYIKYMVNKYNIRIKNLTFIDNKNKKIKITKDKIFTVPSHISSGTNIKSAISTKTKLP
jgi:hypothetical protein